MIQLACETDFVAKTDQFQNSLREIMNTLHMQNEKSITGEMCGDQDYLKNLCSGMKMNKSLDPDAGSQTVEDSIKYTISKTSENIQLVKAF